jgi:hypothetical protein
MTTLADTIRTIFDVPVDVPWTGRWDETSAIVLLPGITLAITPDPLGWYVTGNEPGPDHDVEISEILPTLLDVLLYVKTATEPPEDVDPFQWLVQWTADAIDDGRLETVEIADARAARRLVR